MDPEEQELLHDYRYKNYSSGIEKALRNFESSSEWADLISSLGKLNKALQSNLKYSLLPRRLLISKRLAQCLHPALPSGVHLKALETYEIIFKIVGTKWLAKDLFLYSCGLFPLLAHAAMSVRPVLLGLYEKYFLPLQRLLLPSLQFVIGLLPGLEEGSEIYDRTDALLLRLSLVVGKEVFYAALWGSVLASPAIRLPASLFVVGHISRDSPGKEQKHMLGTDHQLTVKALCASLLDSNVLVQRNTLEIVLFFFPLYTCLDSEERAIPLLRPDVVRILAAAAQTLLRRDMSLNRRLYAWLLGSDIKGNTVMPESETSSSYQDQSSYFFEKYSKDLLVEGLAELLHQEFSDADAEERHAAYLRPFRILTSLLDKPEIGPQVVGDLFLEVIRAFYSYCRDALGSELQLSYTQSGSLLTSTIKENRNASEIVKTVNLLITSLSTDFLWDYMTRCFEDCFRDNEHSGRSRGFHGFIAAYCAQITCNGLKLGYNRIKGIAIKKVPFCLPLLGPAPLPSLCALFTVLYTVHRGPSWMHIINFHFLQSPVKGENSDLILDTKAVIAGDEDASFPALKSEDSGIGLSASSPELSEHLRVPRVSPERDNVWKTGGSMQRTFFCLQELIDNFAHKNIFGVQLTASGEESRAAEPTGQRDGGEPRGPEPSPRGRKNSWDARPISVPQFKQMLSDWFTVRGSPFKTKNVEPPSPLPSSPGQTKGDWAVDQVVPDLGGSSEACREAFAAACHLLLDCATFPIYLSEEETERLWETLFQPPGERVARGGPSWGEGWLSACCSVTFSLVLLACLTNLLHFMSYFKGVVTDGELGVMLYLGVGVNDFLLKPWMVTPSPCPQDLLEKNVLKMTFVPEVARVLWNQLNQETREHHVTCVELFYRLHCLAPTASICEDIICHALLDPDKGTRLEALFRFSVLWHLTREIQGSRVTSHNRSFDRSLFVVLDSLTCTDGAIGAAAQGWLVRALSLGDVARILEPLLLLLLQPKTQRTSIHCLKQENSAEDLHRWFNRKKTSSKEACGVPEGSSEEGVPLNQFTTVDREAIWAEVEKEPEKCSPGSQLSEEDLPYYTDLLDRTAREAPDSSEHTESADTSSAHTDSENTSSLSSPSHDPQELSNEEGCCAPIPTGGRAYPRHAAFLAESIKSSARLSLARVDSDYAFSVLEAVLKTNPKEFIEAVSRTSMDTSSTAHLNLISNLLARHQEALVGQSFYGKLQTQSPNVCPHSLLIELLTYLCLSFLRSYYPCYLKISHRDLLGNRDVQVKSVEVLIRIMTQLVAVAKCTEGKSVEFIRSLLQRCKVQEFVLLSLSASMYTSQKRYSLATAERGRAPREDCLFEEQLINLGQDQIWSEHPLQIELLKLLQVLIVLEHHLGQVHEEAEHQPDLSQEWRRALDFQQAISAMQYVQPHPLTSQGLLVSAVVRGLQPAYGYGMHPAWVSLVTQSLPYFGKSLGWTVTPFIVQICKNLDELVKQYESESVKLSVSITAKRENIAPDYPLTLLEGLTTISHFCLLEQPNQNKKAAAVSDPTSLKNAKNAILEELPCVVNTLALLWDVLRREEAQKRPVDLLGATKGSSSVYFRTTKIIRQKILDFLNPLTAHLGVQLTAAVAVVWSRKRVKRHSKVKIVPVASAFQLTLVDLMCALSTLQTDTVLHLVKEVVRR
uniref:Uncharacterized protein n=1 Tax=Myotis lucifugus TaxID=59463 RepID=G1Q3M1_MYOLU